MQRFTLMVLAVVLLLTSSCYYTGLTMPRQHAFLKIEAQFYDYTSQPEKWGVEQFDTARTDSVRLGLINLIHERTVSQLNVGGELVYMITLERSGGKFDLRQKLVAMLIDARLSLYVKRNIPNAVFKGDGCFSLSYPTQNRCFILLDIGDEHWAVGLSSKPRNDPYLYSKHGWLFGIHMRRIDEDDDPSLPLSDIKEWGI